MAVTSTPVFEQAARYAHTIIVAAHSTRFRPIWRPPASNANGSRIQKIMVATTDAGNNELQLAIGKPITLAANMGTATFVDGGGGSDTITRSAGSFVSDGWIIGERSQALDATTLANDFEALLTAVASGTLTFATATVNTGEAFAAATQIQRLVYLWRKQILANAGNAAAVAAVSMLDTTPQPALNSAPNRFLDLGPDDYLWAKVTTAMGAGETMDIAVEGRDY